MLTLATAASSWAREVVAPSVKLAQGATEDRLREIRYELTEGRGLRATGHTASDQVETVLYRMVSSGTTKAIKPRREDGVVRPLLPLWREETEAYCRERGLPFRVDSSNRDTKRGLIREEILPLLRRLHPAADRNLLALAAASHGSRARSSGHSPSSSPRRPGRSRRISAVVFAPCASTTRCG